MTVGERIQDLRKKKGYTQEKLAAHLNLSRQAVAKWEQNACEPNLDCLVAMAELFEVDLDYLIAGKASDSVTEKAPVTAGKEKKKRPPMSKKKKTVLISVIAAVIALAVVVDTLAMIVLGVGGVAGYLYMASEMAGSKGLEFAKRADGTYNVYVGECTDTDVVIPRRGPDGSLVTAVFKFGRASHITSVTIPDSVTSIGDDAFRGCTGLKSITLPDSVKTIGRNAFWGCSSLESVTIPEGVTTIEYCAFSNCPNLREIHISSTVTDINSNLFGSPVTIGKIIVDENNPTYSSRGNCLVEIESKTLLLTGKEFTIPDDGSVTTIGANAFWGRTDITSITIPAGVKSIDTTAFRGCTSLTSVTLPDTLIKIGDYAFSNCTSLTSVTIPDSVTRLGQYVFQDCASLTTATVSAGLTGIDRGVFEDCVNLESLTIPGSVTSVEYSAIMGCEKLRHIYFSGTMDQWVAIRKAMNDYYWRYTVYCVDGDLKPW